MSDSDPLHQQLLGYLLGALDDDEQEWVELRLERDEEYRRQWMEWRRRLGPLLSMRPDCEPPLGLAEQTCRFVAACAPRPLRCKLSRRKMSPDLALPARGARFGWLDAAAMAVIVLIAAVLVPPAIHNSRFHSRLTSCQEKLRQVGLALTEYGYKHGHALSELADNERLTGAGQFAAELLDHSLAPDDGREVCPDAWLAAQGAHRFLRNSSSLLALADNSPAAMPEVGPPTPTWSPQEIPGVSIRDWLGLWRNGTVDAATDPPPAAMAVLADAPSADSSGQAFACHDGQGRNMFYGDGHVDFLPCSTQRDATDTLLTGDDASATPHVSVPIQFVGWH
jgi:prepilin-type processing-associated H-X9-DG protein